MNPITENPKEAAGRAKTPLHLIPTVFSKQVSLALDWGGQRYSHWNWRDAGVNATTYIGAMRRHLDAWQDGEDMDPDSGLPHIAHIAASCAIILDAERVGKLNDDRRKIV
jgi:hypothetical protein